MKFFKRPSKLWLIILSEFFVNLGAGWIGVIILDPKLEAIMTGDIIALTIKLVSGILSLLTAKYLREESEKWI